MSALRQASVEKACPIRLDRVATWTDKSLKMEKAILLLARL
ncbi:hypothetical protein V7157_23425 [Neobacillus drentensis]